MGITEVVMAGDMNAQTNDGMDAKQESFVFESFTLPTRSTDWGYMLILLSIPCFALQPLIIVGILLSIAGTVIWIRQLTQKKPGMKKTEVIIEKSIQINRTEEEMRQYAFRDVAKIKISLSTDSEDVGLHLHMNDETQCRAFSKVYSIQMLADFFRSQGLELVHQDERSVEMIQVHEPEEGD